MSIRNVPRSLFLLSTCTLGLAACASSPAAVSPSANDELRFTGTIEAIDDSCLADGVCSLTIDGRKVVWMVGWSRDVWGSVSAERKLGVAVDVWCRKTPTGCELRGNTDYFVRPAAR